MTKIVIIGAGSGFGSQLSSVQPLHQLRRMFDELWAAEGKLLDYFKQ
jgi:hypothetical protein